MMCMMSMKVELAGHAATRATEQPDRTGFTGSNSKVAGAAVVVSACFATTSFLPPQPSPLVSHSHTPNAAPANRRRRQILPKPPAQTTAMSSLAQPNHRVADRQGHGSSTHQRKWHSTSSLLKPKSCLRPSRYSSSSIATSADSELVNASIPSSTVSRRDGIIKSVSFYSQVDIFEFQPPLEQASGEGWLSYFF